jgi:hypothetical protein
MEADKETNNQKTKTGGSRRPFMLSILCTAYMVYAGFIAVIFLVTLVKNTWFTNVLTDYFPTNEIKSSTVIIISLVALFVHLLGFAGAILMLKLKRIGFYLYLVSNVIIILVPHVLGYGSLYASGIFISLIILFSFFYRKMQ